MVEKIHRLRPLFIIGVAIAICLAAGLLLRSAYLSSLPEHGEDFPWSAIRVVAGGENPYAKYLDGPQLGWEASEDGAIFFPNYPITIYGILSPFSYFSHQDARYIWAAINVICAILIPFLIWNLTPSRNRKQVLAGLFLGALFIAASPVRDVTAIGQLSLLAFASFLVAVYSTKRGWSIFAGICLAFALIKFTITVPLAFWFVWKKKWTPIWIAGLIHAGLLAAISVYLKTSPVALMQGFIELSSHTLSLPDIEPDVYSIQQILNSWSPEYLKLVHPVTFTFFCLTFLAAFRTKSDLECLALLAFPAMLGWFHFRYDSLVLLLPMLYAWCALKDFRYRILLIAAVLLNWYFVRGIERLGAEVAAQMTSELVGVATWGIFVLWLIAIFKASLPKRERELAKPLSAPAKLLPGR